VTDLGFARLGGTEEDNLAERAIRILWQGTSSVRASYYKIGGKHATPYGS
jgi:hypothetical protein